MPVTSDPSASPRPLDHRRAPPRVRCRECGTRQTLRWDDDINEALRTAHRCFTCDYWADLAERAAGGDPTVVRSQGQHFVIGDPGAVLRGFGGRPFVVEFFDGRVAKTTNLWRQGLIPAHFAARLCDNARITTTLPQSTLPDPGTHR